MVLVDMAKCNKVFFTSLSRQTQLALKFERVVVLNNRNEDLSLCDSL